jgi:DNA-binding CsgD family transcriptional regulator
MSPWFGPRLDHGVSWSWRSTAPTVRAAADAAAAQAAGETLDFDQLVRYARDDDWPLTAPRATAPLLTPREREVAELVAEGLTNRQIADRHAVSARTVASHLESIRRKPDLPTRAHITAWITRERIVAQAEVRHH